MIHTYHNVNPKTVHYGIGSVSLLTKELDSNSSKRVHLISTRSVLVSPVREYVQTAAPALRSATISMVSGHTPIQEVLVTARAAQAANADAIVALGGGSAMDAAKLVALATSFSQLQNLSLRSFKERLASAPADGALPIFSIPTTLSAAEQYGDAGYTDDESGHKVGIANQAMTSHAVIYDPRIAAHTPRDLWVSTGFRALDHAVETVMSADADAISHALSTSAIIDLLTVLPKFASSLGTDEERLAAFLGAWKSYGSPTVGAGGLSHVLGRLSGAKNGIPHGITSCVLLPLVVEHLYAQESRFADRLMELESQLTAATGDARSLSERLRDLNKTTRMPLQFPVEMFTRDARADIALRVSTHPDATPEGVACILENSVA